MKHSEETHYRDQEGRFVVPLPLNNKAIPLGESRTMAVQRFKNLERSLYRKGQFEEFARCISEYFQLGHAESIPTEALKKPSSEVYYMPMHAVWKDSSSTTKLRVVFDASAKSTSGPSLNDQFLVGPTVHPPLIYLLMRFRRPKVAMTTDVSKMYREVIIPEDQRDLHRFFLEGRSRATYARVPNDTINIRYFGLVVCSQYDPKTERTGSSTLGKYNESHTRPILVRLTRACEVQSILSQRYKLSQSPGISIKPDLSQEERAIESLLLKERKALIVSGTERKSIRIRGSTLFVNKVKYGVVRDLVFQRYHSPSDSVLSIPSQGTVAVSANTASTSNTDC